MRVGVVGCGSIALAHISGLINRKVTIVALCDIDMDKATQLNQQFDLNAKVFTSFDRMIADEQLDSIHICTPHYLHTPMIVSALKQDINVFVEKPLCIDVEDIPKLLDAEQKSNAILGVCLQNRYLATNKLAMKLNQHNNTINAHCNVIWSRDAAYYNSADWRGKLKAEGGGVLINQALHTLDLLICMLGKPISVTAHTSNYHLQDVIEVEDTAEGYIEFENGTATFYATTAAPDNLPVEIVMKGDNLIRVQGGKKLSLNGREVDSDNSDVAMFKDYWGVGHDTIIQHFYDCIESGEKFPISVAEGAKCVQLVMAMYRSKGNKISLI